MTVSELSIKYQLDKSEKLHDYARFYDWFFSARQDQPVKLLEIGVHHGDSLRMWHEFFPVASVIVGIDIVDNLCICKCECHEYDFKHWAKTCRNQCKVKCPHGQVSKCLSTLGIRTEIGDAADLEFLNIIKRKYETFDVIIDDGSHRISDQQISFEYLFDMLNNHGIYVIEDLHTSYWDGPRHKGGGTRRPGTTVEFLKDRIDDVNLHGKVVHLGLQVQFPALTKYEREIDSVTFCKSLAFIVKRTDRIPRFQVQNSLRVV